MAQSPCPHKIIDDMGYAFCMGSIGGAVWHGVKGFRNAPRGIFNRVYGSTKSISARAPVTGGNFAVWGLCFSSLDCCLIHIRRKDDPLNAIAAGAGTGAILACRAGMSSMMRSALIGGIFLAVIEGLGLMLAKVFSPQPQGPMSPYSTYQPTRHVGKLDSDEDHASSTQIATNADNSKSWDANDQLDELGFAFDTFGESSNDHNNFGDFDSHNEFGFGDNDEE